MTPKRLATLHIKDKLVESITLHSVPCMGIKIHMPLSAFKPVSIIVIEPPKNVHNFQTPNMVNGVKTDELISTMRISEYNDTRMGALQNLLQVTLSNGWRTK